MLKTIALLIVAGTVLAGCVAVPYDSGRHSHRYERDYDRGHDRGGWRDRDGDGVPNRYDRRPNNPYRY